MATQQEFKAIIFDMDGVLLDTEPLYTVAYDRILKPYGAHLDATTKLEVMGRAALKSAAHVLNKFNIPLTPEEFIEKRKPILRELFAAAPCVPGAEDFIRKLSRRAIPIAVATSTARPLFELKTKEHSWFSLFNTIVCGDDSEVVNPKPAPDIFLTAARRLGHDPKSCAIFEDSPSGVRAGAASGAKVFALVRQPTDLSFYRDAHQIIANFSEAGFDE